MYILQIVISSYLSKSIMFKKLVIIASFAIIVCLTSEDGPVAGTNYGRIQGAVYKSTGGNDFYAFHNIPFAKPPLGELRFKDPELPEPWQGVRDGTKEHMACSHPLLLYYMKDQREYFNGQEDCLYLSVYTPKIDGDPLPVMFFIHGGAFLGGSGTIYTGHDLVDEDVILVSPNYRLGVLGFLSTEDEVMPGNLGLKDQTIALKWIQENIAHFGGDPSRVTIFGESAGGASVHFHILTPSSAGLFNRAILQSGTALCPWTHSKGQKGIAQQVGAAMGCFIPSSTGKQQSQRLLECLQKVDDKSLVMTYDRFMNWTFLPVNFNPYVDGHFIPDEPEVLLKSGRHQSIDIIIGVNKHEGAFITNSLFSPNDFLEKLQKNFNYYGPVSLGLSYEDDSEEQSRKVYDHYLERNTVDVNDVEKLTEMFGDRHFKVCTDIVARMHSQNGQGSNKVYLYELEYKGKRSFGEIYEREFGNHWVAHGDELILLFPIQMFGGGVKRSAKDRKMTLTMTHLWANFAKHGNPTPDESLDFKWDSFKPQSPQYLSLDLEPQMKPYDRSKIYEFWAGLPLRENELLYELERENIRKKSEL